MEVLVDNQKAPSRPMIIYSIPIRNLNTFNQSNQKLANNYLIGISDIDIHSPKDKPNILQVDVEGGNFPLNDNIQASGTYTVQYETTDNPLIPVPYILINSTKYYIYSNRTREVDQLKPESNVLFTFYRNPERITPRYEKLQTIVRTLGGWETQHWGNQLVELTVEAKTGGLHTSNSQPLSSTQTITNSDAWQKLVQLRTIYEKDQSRRNKQPTTLLGLSYLNDLYVGYFTGFNGPSPDAERPYIMDFSFTFKVQEIVYGSGDLSIPGGEI